MLEIVGLLSSSLSLLSSHSTGLTTREFRRSCEHGFHSAAQERDTVGSGVARALARAAYGSCMAKVPPQFDSCYT